MSASEKLRSLERAIHQAMHVDEYAEAVEPLADALPQIRAVVEAAERLSVSEVALVDALAALDEALQ